MIKRLTYCLVISSLLLTNFSSSVWAVEDDSTGGLESSDAEDFNPYNNIFFHNKEAVRACSSDTPKNIDDPGIGGDGFPEPKPITLTGDNVAEKMMNFFLDQEFSEAQAAGILGNSSVESSFVTTAVNPTSGAFGIFQWLGSRLNGEDGLKGYVEPDDKSETPIYTIGDLEAQVQFTMHEIATSEKRTLGIKKITNPTDAAVFWEETYERSGGALMALRISHAEQIYEQWQKSGSLPTSFLKTLGAGEGNDDDPEDDPDEDTEDLNCLDEDGPVTFGKEELEGYAFPIAASKQSDVSTFSGALANMPCNKSCHHDGTQAYDLGVLGYGATDKLFNPNSIGAPVYAISDGVISGKTDNAKKPPRPGCTQFTLKSDKDDHFWWYGHLAIDGSKDIVVGQKVSAGQKLGNVGNSTCADKTMPHLHIDSGGGRESTRNDLVYSVVNGLFLQMPGGGGDL